MATGHEKQKNRKTKSSRPEASISRHDAKSDDDRNSTPKVPLKLQQQCLDIFRDALRPSSDDAATLQEVKGHLYDRNFAAAFGKESYLRVYASRWSPSRALGYLDVLSDVQPHLDLHSLKHGAMPYSVLCLGGGAGGELVALAGWLRSIRSETPNATPIRLHVALVDIADWTGVADELHTGVTTPPQLSKYASQAKKDANEALVEPNDISVLFEQRDLLTDVRGIIENIEKDFAKANLITFMFTLNELYSTSMSKTQDLLTRLTSAVRPGAVLLVVDSPGSYSTISLNGAEKKYPIQWLLDYTLLGPPKKSSSNSAPATWEKLIDDTSQWFRLPTSLTYPIELENMRYQIHLYRRLNLDE